MLSLLSLELLKDSLGLEDHAIGVGLKIGNSLVKIFSDLGFSLLQFLLSDEFHLLSSVDFSEVDGELLPKAFVASQGVVDREHLLVQLLIYAKHLQLALSVVPDQRQELAVW